MTPYRLVLLFKFVGVLLYAGGVVSAVLASDVRTRKLAVHRVASPAIVLVWGTGYTLTTLTHVPLTELWVIGGVLLSLASQLALVLAVARGVSPRKTAAAAGVPLLLVLALMVFRPTWQGFAP